MKKPLILASSLALVVFAVAPTSALAQRTVYSDNFAVDSSDPTTTYLSANTTGGVGWTWANGTGITLNPNASGKLSDLVGSFSAVTLANTGDYVSFVVNFNSPNIGQGGTSLAGNLLFALDNSFGISPTSAGQTESVSSSATGGPTSGYVGYLGDIGFNNSPKTGTKFFAKTGSGNNNLSYNSNVSPKSQLSTSAANSLNATLANNTAYTLAFTITALNNGASQMQINASITDNIQNLVVDNFTLGATNGANWVTPATTFDTFDIGVYTGGETAGYNINLSSIAVMTNVPEPSAMAIIAGGFGTLLLFRRYRR